MASKKVINIDNLEFHEWQHGSNFAGRMGELGEALGAQKLGYNLTVIPAGKRAFPFHSHHVNEEMFFILEGEGELRMGDERQSLRAGDVIACLVGGPETAHQIINTMETGDLKFLAVSTRQYPEICQYPDSGKKLVRHYWEDDSGANEETMRMVIKGEQGLVDYWEDED